MKMNRRQFVAGTAAAGLAVAASPAAFADEAAGTEAAAAEDWLGTAPEIGDDQCVETAECEVLVVGAGCSGWFAACSAAENGAKTMLIETAPAGAGVRGSAIGAVGSRKQAEAGVEIDKVELVNDYASYALNQCDMRLIKLWADNSGEMADWYCDRVDGVDGVSIDLEWNMPSEPTRYKCWPTGHGASNTSRGAGKDDASAEGDVVAILEEYLLSFDAEYRTCTTMQRLIQDETGRVVGVYATNEDDEYIRINASKGVIVCTGGYAWNVPMYMALQGDLARSSSLCVAFPNAKGAGIKACMWAGAQFDQVKTSMLFDRGFVAPDVTPSGPHDMVGGYLQMATQPFLKVDSNGERICNESSPYDYVIHGAASRGNRAWYPIWDANWCDDAHRFHTIGCSTLEMREGSNRLDPVGLEANSQQVEELADAGVIVRADTIAELAEGLGIPADALQATVDRYNELFDMQCDEDFGKEPFRLSAIRQAPFYGVKMYAILLCTLDGIKINTEFQALDTENQPIEGLYVVGNDSGNYYAGTYPNFGAGSNAGRCATFGRMCGRQLAQM